METVPIQDPELLLTIYANNVQKEERERERGRETKGKEAMPIQDPYNPGSGTPVRPNIYIYGKVDLNKLVWKNPIWYFFRRLLTF